MQAMQGMKGMMDAKTLHAGVDRVKNLGLDLNKDKVFVEPVSPQQQAAAAAAAVSENIHPATAVHMYYKPWVQLFVACLTIAISWAILFSPKSRENLKRIGKPILVQTALFAFLLLLPVLWWRYNRDDMAYPHTNTPYPNGTVFAVSSCKFLVSTGVCLIVASCVYHCFPLDFIPEIAPKIGRFNDVVAGVVMGFGISLCVLGYWLGSGPIPSDIDFVARVFRSVFGLMRPWLELLGPFVRCWLNFGADVSKYLF